MSDRPIVQSQSWRPQRDQRTLDPRVVWAGLAGLGMVALAGMGYAGYALVGRPPRAVPVVEADARPVRVRPDNPGGMQVAGAEEQIMGGADNGRADTMAPPPEVPQPQALRAQIEAARQPAPPPAMPAQPVSLSSSPQPQPPAISALPEQRAAMPPRAAAQPRPTPAPGPVAVGAEVQLAAMPTEAGAMAEWQRLAKRMPDLLGSRRPAVQRAEHDGKTFYRLRTGGFGDVSEATSFCTQVRAKGGGCSVASF